MSLKPILFNSAMVKKIIKDEKSSTRRLIKAKGKRYENESVDDWCIRWGHKQPCKPNDVLWVRESFMKQSSKRTIYKADYSPKELEFFKKSGMRWTPSIHMPYSEARIFLSVKNVYAQELKDITVEQAISEGVSQELAYECNNWVPTYNDPDSGGYPDYIEGFKSIWDATISKDKLSIHGWEANPYVWVIEFERLEEFEEIFYRYLERK